MANDLSSSTSRLNIHGQTLPTATYVLVLLHRKYIFLQSNLRPLQVLSRIGLDLGAVPNLH